MPPQFICGGTIPCGGTEIAGKGGMGIPPIPGGIPIPIPILIPGMGCIIPFIFFPFNGGGGPYPGWLRGGGRGLGGGESGTATCSGIPGGRVGLKASVRRRSVFMLNLARQVEHTGVGLQKTEREG